MVPWEPYILHNNVKVNEETISYIGFNAYTVDVPLHVTDSLEI